MFIRSCIIICSFFIVGMCLAAPLGGAWQKANAFYAQKQYDSAAYYYEQLAAGRPQQASLYYNLGNTYYRLNRIGPAVLNFQRALYIDPGYKDAADDLALTESRISNRLPSISDIFFVKWWRRITSGTNATAWSITSLLVFIIIIALAFARIFRKAMGIPPQVTGVLIFVLLGLLILAFISSSNRSNSDMGVVMQNDAPLLNEQHTNKAQALIPEGTTVTILDERAGWTEVRLPDGRTGWLQQTFINKI